MIDNRIEMLRAKHSAAAASAVGMKNETRRCDGTRSASPEAGRNQSEERTVAADTPAEPSALFRMRSQHFAFSNFTHSQHHYRSQQRNSFINLAILLQRAADGSCALRQITTSRVGRGHCSIAIVYNRSQFFVSLPIANELKIASTQRRPLFFFFFPVFKPNLLFAAKWWRGK